MTFEDMELTFESPMKTRAIAPLLPLDAIPKLVALFDAAGYRVIPKSDIRRVRAEIEVDTLHEEKNHDVIIQVMNMLASQIGRELRPVLNLHRGKTDTLYLTATYSTEVEVIKP